MKTIESAWHISAPVLILLFFLLIPLAAAQEPMKVELGQTEAWTGQPVELYLTVRAPGPFSGQPRFDLPEISGLYFLPTGRPVVGSETVDGAEYFTQRHKWLVFSQRSGSVTIPPIRVRFEARRSYTGDPEPFSATSQPVILQLKRPPGFAPGTPVVTTVELSATQSWAPSNPDHFQAGDAIVRTVTRTVDGASAMMLPPLPDETLVNAQTTIARPEVGDAFDRGLLAGTRVDKVTYQFPGAGRAEIPSIKVNWWNPETEALESLALPGRQLDIQPAPLPPPLPRPWWQTALIIIGALAALVPAAGLGRFAWRKWEKWRNSPERILARRFTAACRHADAETALTEMLAWENMASPAAPMPAEYQQQREALLAARFAAHAHAAWNAHRHATAFRQWRSARHVARTRKTRWLPALNP